MNQNKMVSSKKVTSSRIGYKIIDDLFVIPDEGKYILYAPLHKSLLAVNAAAVSALQEFKKGKRNAINPRSNLFKNLLSAGMIVSAQDSKQAVSFRRDEVFNPSGVSLFLTTRCSMRCIYCYGKGGDSGKVMTWKIAKAAIDWIVNHVAGQGRKNFYVNFHGGGEVTMAMGLMKKCVEYIRQQAKLKGLTVNIDAGLNGIMSAKNAEWISKNLNSATFSLDGLPEIQNTHRPLSNGRDSFEKVSQTLKYMDSQRFNYGIRATVTQNSLDKLAESVDFICKNFDPKGGIQVEPFFEAGRALANKLPPVDPQAFVRKYKEADIVAHSYGKRLKYSGARFETVTNIFCKAAGNSFAVTPDSQITSCYEVTAMDDPRAPLFFYGRLDETDGKISFDQEKISKLLSLTVENKTYCSKCFCKWHCAGDCPAKLALAGNAWEPSDNPRCYINQELTKEQIKNALHMKRRGT